MLLLMTSPAQFSFGKIRFSLCRSLNFFNKIIIIQKKRNRLILHDGIKHLSCLNIALRHIGPTIQNNQRKGQVSDDICQIILFSCQPACLKQVHLLRM